MGAMKISWEFPAKAFAVSLSEDGEHWSEVFATSVNVESSTAITLEGRRASKVRLVMQEPHPLDGALGGHMVYGVRSVSVLSPRLHAVADNCATAARSKDARDKYFASFVSGFDPASSQALQSELPLLTDAKAALSAAVSEVMSRIPKASMCRPRPLLAETVDSRIHQTSQQVEAHADSGLQQGGVANGGRALSLGSDSIEAAVAHAVDVEYGLGAATQRQTLGSARAAIVRLRSLLS